MGKLVAGRTRRHSLECVSPPSDFFIQNTLPGSMRAKFKDHIFSHFGAVSI